VADFAGANSVEIAGMRAASAYPGFCPAEIVTPLSTAARASDLPRVFNANFASASFSRARSAAAAFAPAALFRVLLWLFDVEVFLADAAFANLFAAARVGDAVPALELFRFRFNGFVATFFIFARMALGATRALDAGFVLPTRLRTLDEDAPLEERFDAVFALEADGIFLIFDFAVFFDFLRAAIVKLSTRPRTI